MTTETNVATRQTERLANALHQITFGYYKTPTEWADELLKRFVVIDRGDLPTVELYGDKSTLQRIGDRSFWFSNASDARDWAHGALSASIALEAKEDTEHAAQLAQEADAAKLDAEAKALETAAYSITDNRFSDNKFWRRVAVEARRLHGKGSK